MAFLVGRAHYASGAVNVSIQNSEGKLCSGLSCPSLPAPHKPFPLVSLLCPLLDLEFQPQTHRAVNWEKDTTISF